jgi:2-polyprenyl-3-methyl-5-hydroxy-6-metoxy-1,4-benzoquinol methylase
MLDTDQHLLDKIKAYWNRQPCNILHGRSELGTVEFYQEVSERRYRVEPHIREFAGFHLWAGKRVLEIGSGIGSDAEEFAKRGAEYVGVDYSDQSVEIARQRFKVLELDGEFHNIDASDGQALSALGKFDLVYSYGVIHHFPAIDTIVNNVHQALNPGGEFRFMVYAKNSWKYAMIQKGLDQFEAQSGCPYAQAYTREDIHRMLEGQFHIERLRQDHCFMYNVPAYKSGRYELEPWFDAMPEDIRSAVKEYLGWHLLVKAKKQ